MIKILVFALCSLCLVVLLQTHQKNFVIPFVICTACIILGFVLHELNYVLAQLKKLTDSVGLNMAYIEILLKILGVSYLCEFVSAVCRDSGQSAIALKIDLLGKITILSASLPVFFELMRIITSVL